MKTIVNCATGEQTTVAMTAQEIEEVEAQRAASDAAQEEAAATEEQRQKDKESGNQKLKDLGLTDDEIAAITS